ncbi:MAG: shikimate dehydrogenase family protein [Gemmatimonadota bacterium]
MPGPATRLVVLLGDPVEHSLSPQFQNPAIGAAGIDAVYVPLRCDADRFPGLLRGIAGAGGAGNVTLPHKTRAAGLLDRATAAVEQTGACNTFWAEGGWIHGDNTDVDGFARAARRLIGSPAGARVLVLGAGGAARAVVLALIRERADAIHLLNRTPGRARAVAEALDPGGRRVAVIDTDRGVAREGYDLVVNATSLGLDSGDPAPLDLDRPVRVGAVLDLVYRQGGTAWVREAETRQIPAADDLEMLLQQGAASFRQWFDRDPDLTVMRAALGL